MREEHDLSENRPVQPAGGNVVNGDSVRDGLDGNSRRNGSDGRDGHNRHDGGDGERGGEPFYVIGHRGAPCVEVENSIASFERALTVDGANGLELDLSMTSDGVVVVWHDWDPEGSITIARCQGLEPDVKFCPCVPEDDRFQKRISQISYDDFIANFGYSEKGCDGPCIKGTIPKLEELLEWAGRRPELELLFLDVKVPEDEVHEVPRFMSCVERAIERARPRYTIVFETYCQTVLDAMKRYNPRHNYSLDAAPAAGIIIHPSKFSAVDRAIANGNAYATAERPRASTLAPWSTYKSIIDHDIERQREHNRAAEGTPLRGLVCYTINDEEEMRWLIEKGVMGVQTDRPDALRKVVDEMGVRS